MRWALTILRNTRARRCLLAVGALALLAVGIAGLRVRTATDPARVEPITLPADLQLRDGDIILAGGVTLQSRAVLTLAGGQRYSHVGIVVMDADGPAVIHASPRGAGDGGRGDRVAQLPLDRFLGERGYVAVRILRLCPDDSAEPSEDTAGSLPARAAGFARDRADRATPFDHRYDLADDAALYCSELVWLAYQDAGLDWGEAILTHATLTRSDGPVILPGSFADSAHFATLWDSDPDTPPKGQP